MKIRLLILSFILLSVTAAYAGRQYLIPGGQEVNEESTRQYLIPGDGYINETQTVSAVVYNAKINNAVLNNARFAY